MNVAKTRFNRELSEPRDTSETDEGRHRDRHRFGSLSMAAEKVIPEARRFPRPWGFDATGTADGRAFLVEPSR